MLQDALVIRRARSEGDRRRTYVQLRLADPIALAAQPVTSLVGRRVVFVCTHNSARSQLAAATWRQLSAVPVASAGTHPAARVHPGADAAGRRHGLRLGRARPAGIQQVVQPDDLVVAVCDNAHEEMDPGGSRLHWSIPDPVRIGTDDAFDTACAQITDRIRALAGPAVRTIRSPRSTKL